MQIINLLLLCGNLSYAGAQRQLVELAKHINKEKFKVTVCSLSNKNHLKKELLSHNIKFIEINYRLLLFPIIIYKLMKIIKVTRTDIIYSFLFQANTFSRIIKIFNWNLKVIASERSSDTIVSIYQKTIEILLKPFTHIYIANSYAGENNLINKFKISDKKIKVIHNGIDLLRFEKTNKDKPQFFNNKDINIVMVGRIKPDKNYEMFLDVAEKVCLSNKNVKFFIVGDHSKNNISYYNKIFSKYKIIQGKERVIFIGAQSNIPALLSEIDISILTSHREGCSNTVLESMFAKCPLVLTDVGDNKIIVSDENKPYIVKPGDVDGMVYKISQLIESEKLRKQIGEANYKKAIDNFTVNKMVRKTEKVIMSSLEN